MIENLDTNIGPLLRGESFGRGPVFWHYPHYSGQGGSPGAAVRWGEWKLIDYFEDGRKELYNLVQDGLFVFGKDGDEGMMIPLNLLAFGLPLFFRFVF